jgi:hypothetical protein
VYRLTDCSGENWMAGLGTQHSHKAEAAIQFAGNRKSNEHYLALRHAC